VDDEDKEASQKDQERERQILADTLILSINGIAQGMKNSG
jgi:phosphoenolpyruvate carboxylase